MHTNGKAEHTFGNLPQAYKFTLSVSAQAPSGRWSEPQSAKIETAMGCAPPAPPSFGGKGMETNLYLKLGAGGEGGGMGALSATRSQNVGLMTGGEYSYPGLPSYRDEASGIGAAAIVGGSIVVAAILVVILLMVNPPAVLGTPRAPALSPRESSPLTPSPPAAVPARFVYWLCCPCLEFGAQREDMKRVTKSLVGGKGAKKRGGFKDDGSDSLDSTDDDSDDEERGRTGPTRR